MSEYARRSTQPHQLEDLPVEGTIFESEIASEPISFDDMATERRAEALMDGSGRSYDDVTRTAVSSLQRRTRGTVTARPAAEQQRPRVSRRGGRSYQEPSDSDLDDNFKRTVDYLPSDQIALNNARVIDVRSTLPTDVDKAHAKRELAIRNADPDYYDRDVAAADRAFAADMRKIADKKK